MDMPGTALSLSAAILGALQGQIGSMLHKWLDYKYKLKTLKSNTYLKDKANARLVSGTRFLITRRILAILTGIYIFVGPMLAAYFAIPIYSSYSESNGFFASMFYGPSTIHWESVQGYVLSPIQTYLSSLVWTMYFGISNE